MIMVHMRTLQPPKCLYVEPKQKHTVGLKTAMYTNTSRNHFNKKQTELQRIITNVYSEAACLVSPQIMANTLMISYHASWASLSLSLSLSLTHTHTHICTHLHTLKLENMSSRREAPTECSESFWWKWYSWRTTKLSNPFPGLFFFLNELFKSSSVRKITQYAPFKEYYSVHGKF